MSEFKTRRLPYHLKVQKEDNSWIDSADYDSADDNENYCQYCYVIFQTRKELVRHCKTKKHLEEVEKTGPRIIFKK